MTTRRDWAFGIWLLLGAPLMLLFVGVPANLALNAKGLATQLSTDAAREAMSLSFRTTFTSLALVLMLGTPLAHWVARGRFPLRRLVDALIDLPVVLPPAAAGIGLLLLFGRLSAMGSFLESRGVSLAFTETAVVLAQVFVASPFYVRTAVSAFSSIDREAEQSAAIDGASRMHVLRLITLPLLRKSLMAGAAMCWARSLGEFGATILFAGNFEGRTQTMPLAIYAGFESDLSSAIAMSCVLLAVALVVLLLAKLMDR